MKDEKKAAGLLVGLLEEEPKPKPGKGAEEAGDEEGDDETMGAARIDALKAFKAALDAEDFEAADEALDDYRAACEG